ncbi:hypothetical protein ACHAWF_002987 [Thalassiosira exigua]
MHWDTRCHTGDMMSLRKGTFLNYSNKHKLNVKSSTEGKLVGTHTILTNIMYTLYFIEGQGYTAEQNIMCHDNKATMRLEANGCLSGSKHIKHNNFCFSFVTDNIQSGELFVKYCYGA